MVRVNLNCDLSTPRTAAVLELMVVHHGRVCGVARAGHVRALTWSLAVASLRSSAWCCSCSFWYSSCSVSKPVASCRTSLSASV